MRAFVLFLVVSMTSLPANGARTSTYSPSRVQELLDAGLQQEAVEILDRQIRKNPSDSQALYLRSTAHIMAGDLGAGRRDLQACLEADPRHRSAWLNRAALDMAESNFAAAVEAFLKAEELAPEAPDNSLNIGAALLLAGERERASGRFSRYLEMHQNDASAYYLVAANYAMADRPELAIPLLRRSIQLDEKTRLRVRADPNFSLLEQDPDFQNLLQSDNFAPEPGSLTASRTFDLSYSGRDSAVLDAVLTALQRASAPIDSGVEVTPAWALIWSDMRIKIAASTGDKTTVSLWSPREAMSQQDWNERTADFFRRVTLELSSRRIRTDN